jgi:hypothetical protein
VTLSVEPDAPVTSAPVRDSGVVRVLGLVVCVLATVVTSVVELYLTPLRLGGVPI